MQPLPSWQPRCRQDVVVQTPSGRPERETKQASPEIFISATAAATTAATTTAAAATIDSSTSTAKTIPYFFGDRTTGAFLGCFWVKMIENRWHF